MEKQKDCQCEDTTDCDTESYQLLSSTIASEDLVDANPVV